MTIWPKEEIETKDNKTRKLFAMHGGLHHKSSTVKLYKKWKDRDQGLLSVRATIQDRTTKIHEYIKEIAPNDDLLSEGLRPVPMTDS